MYYSRAITVSNSALGPCLFTLGTGRDELLLVRCSQSTRCLELLWPPFPLLRVLSARLLWFPFELRVKGIKTFEAFVEDLLIGQSLLGPTLEDLFNSEAFDPVKLFILQIGVVD
jgi:hypothetical protein